MANLCPPAPNYLTLNRVGTYIFQVRIPVWICRQLPSRSPLFRCSLGTKDRGEALRRVRQLWLQFDELVRSYSVSGDSGSLVEQIEALKAYRGAYDLPVVCQPPQGQLDPKLPPESPTNPSALIPLPGLVDEFMRHKRDTGARAASLKWYGQKVHQFAVILQVLNGGSMPSVCALSVDLVRNYAKVMQRYPKHAQTRKLTRDMTEAERVHLVLEKSRADLECMGIEPMGFQTIGHNFTAVKEILRFAERQQYQIHRGLGDLLVTPRKRRGGKPQVKFDSSDLKAMFYSEEYRAGSFRNPSEYWVPLLALFGGQTQAELCQLHVADIRRSGDIWYIDINDQDEKQLKTELGRPRQVPIHQQLVRLGFLDFVSQCRTRGQVRLFPNEVRNENDKYAGYSKRFNRWRKRLGIQCDSNGGRKTFHSFRHLVADWLVGNQCHPGVAADIIGHEGKERLETRRTYSDGAWLREKNNWIQRLDYGLRWSKIKGWKEQATE